MGAARAGISRRGLIVVAGGAAVAGLFSLVPGRAQREVGIIKAIVLRRFGEVRIGEADLESFSEDFVRRQRAEAGPLRPRSTIRASFPYVASVVGVGVISKVPVGPVARWLDGLERAVVTEFILATNVLEARDRVEYHPITDACGSPFAQFGAESAPADAAADVLPARRWPQQSLLTR